MQAGTPDDITASAASATLRLEVISGNAAGQSITVEDELVIGRLAAGEGRLEEDPELSRHHARISRERDGRFSIEDLGSSNGTFVNGLGLTSPGLLELGDSIELGGTTLVVRELTGAELSAATAATQTPTAPDPFRDATVFAPVPAEPEPETESPTEAPSTETAPDPFRDATVFAPVPDEPPETESPATAPSVESEPEPEPAPAAEPLPALDVRVSVDADARTAELTIGDGAPLRFVLQDGTWTFTGPSGS